MRSTTQKAGHSTKWFANRKQKTGHGKKKKTEIDDRRGLYEQNGIAFKPTTAVSIILIK